MKYNKIFIILLFTAFACQKSHQKLDNEEYAALSEEDKRSVAYALEGINLADSDLEIELFASEPMMRNPTNMDIDDKGRVWICEGFNYRNELNPQNPYKKKGDRILIMEDTDHDGKADTSKVYYQGEDINSALGIGVFGNKVIVSCSPNVFVFTDLNGDDIPDKKEILFTVKGGEQHDHGMHAITFGPDGKFYFNFGNAGDGMFYSNGKPFTDAKGRLVENTGKPYREGMVFRSDIDGSNAEILAWNFRNNYEVAVDSYGRMWQSDNDDDGNRGTRINFVMDYGNYGFKDEITGADWRTRRVNMEDSVFHRHWHLNDPGVIPNLLQTYAGSPTGMTVYEGDLLPEKYQGNLLHTDAGPNVLRSYPIIDSLAGFTSRIVPILDGKPRDNWFRPSDVTVAPDGSVFVADWYDPGVGGHAMGDSTRGRIYRITTRKKRDYTIEKPDYDTLEGLMEAIKSPNVATRYIAWQKINEKGTQAENALYKMYTDDNPIMQARAFWLLSKLPNGVGQKYVREGGKNDNELLRVAAIRAARELSDIDFSDLYLQLSKDESPQVRREVAIAIRFKDAYPIWKELVQRYDGKDRWYLEALGIAAEDNWDSYLKNYLTTLGDNWKGNEVAKNIIWRSRSSRTMDLLGQIIMDAKPDEKPRFYRAMDFQTKGDKNGILMNLLSTTKDQSEKLLIFKQLKIDDIEKYPKLKEEVLALMPKLKDTDFLDLYHRYPFSDQKEKLLTIMKTNPELRIVIEAGDAYVKRYGIATVKNDFFSKDTSVAISALQSFGLLDSKPIIDLLKSVIKSKTVASNVKREAMEAMNGWNTEEELWKMVKNKEVPEEFMDIAKRHLKNTWHNDIRYLAFQYFGDDEAEVKDASKFIGKKGDVAAGKTVFSTYCLACHKLNGEGVDFGPGLSQIGGKLSEQALYAAILNPSQGMGFGYETFDITLKNGESFQAIVNTKTENELRIKLPGQADQTVYAMKEVASVKQNITSLMPQFALEDQQLIDLVSYLRTLK